MTHCPPEPNFTDDLLTSPSSSTYNPGDRRRAGRIIRGDKPGDLSIIQSTKFEFVLNVTTAKTLGLDIPPTLLALADEIIHLLLDGHWSASGHAAVAPALLAILVEIELIDLWRAECLAQL
jgi:hypothetical protein